MIREIKIQSHDLRGIADALDSLASATGVKITSFEYHGFVISVCERDSQMDGKTLYVTGISNATTSS